MTELSQIKDMVTQLGDHATKGTVALERRVAKIRAVDKSV
jgi:hypothetical protein